jgi:uncharacterized protein (TIGR02285 family)
MSNQSARRGARRVQQAGWCGRAWLCLVGAVLAGLPGWVRAQGPDVLEVRWVIHSLPFVHAEQGRSGSPKGFLDRMLHELLIPNLPGLLHSVDQVPIPRRNQALQSDARACSPGMIVSDERRAFTTFSVPVIRMLPSGAFGTRRVFGGLGKFISPEGNLDLERVITTGAAHVAVADGRSYGQVVDALLVRLRGRGNLTFISGEGTTEKLARMIRAGHADLVLGLVYEADLVSREAGLEGVDLEFWPITEQERLHQLAIGCHQGTQGAAVIARINALFAHAEMRRQAQAFYDALLRPQDLKRLRALMPPEPASGPGRQRP